MSAWQIIGWCMLEAPFLAGFLVMSRDMGARAAFGVFTFSFGVTAFLYVAVYLIEGKLP